MSIELFEKFPETGKMLSKMSLKELKEEWEKTRKSYIKLLEDRD